LRIVIVEDNLPLADGLAKAFEADGHGVNCLFNGADAEEFLLNETADLIILDINLPSKTGLEVLKSLRQRNIETPVLLLTARDEQDDKIAGLDIGADDYMTKPFDLAELKARARALLRRSEKKITSDIILGQLALNLEAKTLKIDNENVELPRREYALAEALLKNKDRVLSKSQILEHLYGVGGEADEAAVELYIHRLRKRITGSGVEIKTVRGLGYCLREQS